MAGNINKDVLRVIKPYIDEAVGSAITAAVGSEGAVTNAITAAIEEHAAKTAGTSAGNVHPGPAS